MSTPADAPGVTSFTDDQLVRVARLFASDESLAAHLDDVPDDDVPDDGVRRRVSLASTPHLEMWAITWPAHAMSEWHDHGGASGAFVVVRGALLEERWRSGTQNPGQLYGPDEHSSFGPGLIHRTSAFGDEPALSVHAYAPGLDGSRTYDLVDGSLVEVVA